MLWYLSVPQVVRRPFAALKERGTEKRTYSKGKGGDYGGSKDKRARTYGWVRILARLSSFTNAPA